MIHGRSGHGGSLSSRRAEALDDLAGESGAVGAMLSVMPAIWACFPRVGKPNAPRYWTGLSSRSC
ncbi:protein of unknown function [uncultured Sphingopyxis sp.]|uniref:Uncharacterized protein n=1 Tax=uncultured Sphingopyxis sp. TaxID=310581 RepID=A0A1Y5PUE9_9SPHN|nr:protein of unknown function [uncultured Sphingopyxis sp.]